MPSFEGIFVPLVTPFHNGQVDYDSMQRLAEDISQSGVHGLVVCGTTGEAATIDENEQASILSATREAVGSRCSILMGVSGSDTRSVADKVARYTQYDIAGFLISAPSYVRPSQQGILLHFQAVSAATDRPIVLYNIPARTGVNIGVETAISLSRDPRFVAIKECGGQVPHLTDLVNNTSLKVLSGDDALILTTLCLGGHGAISAAAHIRPDLYLRMFEFVRCGRIEPARAIFNAMLPLIQLLFSEPNPGPLKAVLALQGRMHEELRLPMTPVSRTCKERLGIALEKVMAL